MRTFVDSNNASDLVACRSRTGFIVIFNNDPIFLFSKKKGSCETSSFGSEFEAMKSFCEHLRDPRYKRCLFVMLG